MENFKFTCPFCKVTLECDENTENQQCSCPGCGNNIVPVRNKFEGKIRIITEETAERKDVPAGVVINNYSQPQQQYYVPANNMPKQRIVYILLGIFLGGFGAHNFYAGYHTEGILQLAVTIIALATMPIGAVLYVIVGGWALANVIFRSQDSRNRPMV